MGRKLIMYKLLILFLSMFIFTHCASQDKNELLLKAYKNNDYARCLEILQKGADGRMDYLKQDAPLLFDICLKYLDNNERLQEIEELFNFYLKYRKEAFEDSIKGLYPKQNGLVQVGSKQTVGSYLARHATVELLRKIVQNKININSPDEKPEGHGFYSAIYDLAVKNNERPSYAISYGWIILPEEKKVRMGLLLDAGADVTMTNDDGALIFHFFSWWPMEEDYTEILDRMIAKGADLYKKDRQGDSCIYYALTVFALESNTEAYLEYVIGRGLDVMENDLLYFLSNWYSYMVDDETPETDLRRLRKILRILEENLKVTVELLPKGGWRVRNTKNSEGKR